MPSPTPRPRAARAAGLRGILLLAALGASSCAKEDDHTAAIRTAHRGRTAPSILLIVVDTLRADHLGAYGFKGDISPNADALARRGVRLERYTTVVPTTLASFTSMLTGRHTNRHGVFRNGVVWPAGLEGMQSEFQNAGYETAAFVSSYCLTAGFGLSRGFEHFDENLTVEMKDLKQNKLVRTAADVTAAAGAWLAGRRSDDRPFFAMVHYFDPHWPYQPPAPYDTMFDPGYRGTVTGSIAEMEVGRTTLRRSGGVLDADTRHLEALYAGDIRYADDEIGKLLGTLERLGLAGNTLVVFTADHGETLHEHDDYFDHGPSVYDTEIRIPLIIGGPGIDAAGRVVTRPASNIDLAPTLLDYAGLSLPAGYEGRSFLDSLRDPEPTAVSTERALFAEATKPFGVERNQRWPNRLKARCILHGPWKVINTPWRENRWELYDLVADPVEQRNLWGQVQPPREAVDQLAAALEQWSGTEPGNKTSEAPVDSAVLERLKSLGYAN